MPNIKLTYFDFNGGRGEVARIALTLGGIAFEDDRFTFAEWKARRAETPYAAVPVLEVDGQTLAQSNAINRYVGKLAGLYPTDPWQAALCDEVLDAVEEIGEKVVGTFGMKGEALETARKALADGPISLYVKRLGSHLESRGEWFADGRLTVADLRVYLWVRHLRSGNLDHIPKDLPDRIAPRLVEHFERVGNHAGVKKYYEGRDLP